jgi:hypothetical protein
MGSVMSGWWLVVPLAIPIVIAIIAVVANKFDKHQTDIK